MKKRQTLPHEKAVNLAMDILQTSLNGIVFALEAKDEYSSQHSRRVAAMCRAFAVQMGYSEYVQKQLFVAASVHDIGKIGIPDSILLSEHPLTEEQWQVMRSHPDVGADIIAKTIESGRRLMFENIPFPAALEKKLLQLEEGIRHHHERWDGTGYPAGLQGEQIPVSARIIALCDSTDAMMSNRRYRKALSAAVCRGEIEKNSGVMYDPALAQTFLENWGAIVTPVYAPAAAPSPQVMPKINLLNLPMQAAKSTGKK